ncbi:hypothetical protein NFI96_004602 [Prochilodus magdalenae]|nr:hypothetical protein NFI96_004602 [Prochilodus magdalenae]
MMFLCVMLLIFSGFMDTISVNFTVVGPAAPLVVEAGKDLVLPCSLQPRISAVDMMVEWIRTDQSESINVVHLYEDYKDRIYEQMESYKGRTALFKDEMLRGNTSLKLSAVQPSDEGAYKCVIQYRSWNGAIPVYVEVIENFKIVGATAPLIAEAGEDLVLPCSIKPSISAEDATVEWTRMHLNDRLVHFYKDFKDKNDDQMKSYRGRTALFKEELKKGNASLKLSTLRLSDAGTYKCYIESIFWKDGIIVYLEVKDKSSKKKLSSAQCSYITYMRLQSQHVRKELNLKKYNTSEEGFIRLIPAITKCRKAQFSDCNLTASSIKLLSAALQTDSSALKELDLSSNDLFDSGMEILSTGLKSPTCKLETLRIVKCKLSNSSCDALRSVLQASSSLKVLDLSENDLQDSGIELLSDGFKSLHCKLEILRLILCNLGRKTCEYLGSALQSKTCPLKELDLSKNNLQDAGMKTLSAGLESPQCKLEILRLAMCDIGIKTCENLEIALKQKNCCLKELDLSNNDLQDSGVKKLSDGLKGSHCKLEIVRLSGCMITEEGCCSLALALTSNPSCLNELDVTYNHTGASGVKMLTARLKDPQCLLTTLRMEHGGEIRIRPGLKK